MADAAEPLPLVPLPPIELVLPVVPPLPLVVVSLLVVPLVEPRCRCCRCRSRYWTELVVLLLDELEPVRAAAGVTLVARTQRKRGHHGERGNRDLCEGCLHRETPLGVVWNSRRALNVPYRAL